MKKIPLVLILAALVAMFGGFLFGYDTAVINGANHYLTACFHLTPFQEGIAGASAILGCIPGAMCAGVVSDRFGRRRVLFLCAVLYALSGVFSAIPRTFMEFLIARFVGGLGIGVSSMICPVYIAEVAPSRWRGTLGSLFQFGIVTGILLTLFVNARIQDAGDEAWNIATGWRWMLAAEVVPAVGLLGLLFAVPESPRWLLQMGRREEAKAVFARFAGTGDPVIAAREDTDVFEPAGTKAGLWAPLYRRALIIAVVLMAASQFSGINAVMYYSTKIFSGAGEGLEAAFRASVLVGVVNFIFTLVAMVTVDRLGRRRLLIIGLTVQTIMLTIVGLLLHQGHHGVELTLAILAFIAAFAMALGPLPWIICAEIFPTAVRGRAMSAATFVIWTTCYLVAQTFPMLHDSAAFGPAPTFGVYALCSLAALIFVCLKLPETKGRPVDDPL